MTTGEKDDMIEKILADHDAAIASTTALMQLEAETIIECKVSDEDFVWSSR
jgi:hypothetical protein